MKTPQPRLLFGTAGVPLCSPGRDPASGVKAVFELGLEAMEVEFVYGVRMNAAMLEKTRQAAEKYHIALTCHAPYYINLNAAEPEKLQNSIQRILDTARIAHKLRARSINFHAGFYLKQDPKKVHAAIRDTLKKIQDTLDQENNPVQIRPELTGKPSQYGSLPELLALAEEIRGVLPCIDFSHLCARSNGRVNNQKEFEKTLLAYRQALGKKSLKDMHLHVSGIEYSEKGEKRHLKLEESNFKIRSLLKALKIFGVEGVLICESPDMEKDATYMQNLYRRLSA